jgi:uncharacterized membrane protein YhaH (DUF805 family)
VARLVPYFVLLAEVLAFYRHVLFYGGYSIPWDLRTFHLPFAEFIARSFRNGELPLWNPYTYCGMPVHANLQAQLFYPPTILTIWLSNLTGAGHLLYFLEWQIVLHVFLGGVFTFLLLKKLGVETAAALLGATVFQLGGFFASQTQHLGAMNGAAWLPLAWLSVISLAAKRTWRWTAALAVGLAMALLAGFSPVAVVVAGSTILLAAILVFTGRARRKLWWAVALAGVWAAALAAVQVAPAIELTRLSVAALRSEFMGTGGGLRLESLVSLILPDYYGIFDLSTYSQPWQPTFLYLYIGVPGLMLAAAAALVRRTPHAPVFGWLALLSALWMLGDSTPAGKAALSGAPAIVKSSMYPEFAMASFIASMAVLAGLGAHRFFGSARPAVKVALVAIAALDLIATGSGRPMNTGSLQNDPGLTYTHFDGNAEVLSRVRSLTRRGFPPDRIDTLDDSMNWAMGAALTGIPTANGNDPFALYRLMQVRLIFTGGERWGRYYQVSRPESPVLDLLNVRYLLSRKPVGSAGLERVAQLPGRDVYENPDALPRFFLVHRIHPVRSMEQGLRILRSPDFRPAGEAVVEGPVQFGAAAPSRAGSVTVSDYRPRRVRLEVKTSAPAFLVSSEAFYPGWKAWVDGREQPLVLTNVAFRGLALAGGTHTVEMRFEPAILWWSAAISLAAWLAAAACLAPNTRRRASTPLRLDTSTPLSTSPPLQR